MALVVQKFGGTSVATAERIMAAARRAIRAHQDGNQVIVVVSARGDTTDELIELAHQISEHPPAREMDMLLATGEQISIALLAMAIHTLGQPALSFTGAQVGIVTDDTHTKARIKSIATTRMRRALEQGNIVIVAGFQGIDENDNITTLGRGGSDTTAVALAAVMKHSNGHRPSAIGNRPEDRSQPADGPMAERRQPMAEEVGCEIYTDVDGVYTTDPRVVPEARKLDELSYDEMLELASVGAGVMHSRSIEFASKFDVPVQVRSSFSDVEGTWIVPEADWMGDIVVCGAALVRDEARVLIEGVPDRPGVSHRVFTAIAARNIVVDMIAQNVGQAGRAAIGFTVPGSDLPTTLDVVRALADEFGATVDFEKSVSKVSIVGTGMRTHAGVAERMFAALSAEGINLKMITTGDIKISVLVDKNDGLRALRAVHQAFNLAVPRPGAGLPARRAGEGGHPEAEPFRRRPDAVVRESTGRDLTALTLRLASMEDILVSDVQLTTDQGQIAIFGLPDVPGNCSKVFQAIAAGGIVVDMIVQNLSGSKAELTFSVPLRDLANALRLTQTVVGSIDPSARVEGEGDLARVIVLGVGMRSHTGVARRMFGALAERGINIRMINTSEVRLSVVVDRPRGEEALACLKDAFNL
ncbi:MAG: aspartate kinase [Planctomycetes bacterium]|nr:aspartate kinase [Planctomycetota bacterium]